MRRPRALRVALQMAINADDHLLVHTLLQSTDESSLTGVAPHIPLLLRSAIRQNKSRQLRQTLVQFKGANLNFLLKVAVRGDDAELARFLLDAGAHPNRIDMRVQVHLSAAMQDLIRTARRMCRARQPATWVSQETALLGGNQ